MCRQDGPAVMASNFGRKICLYLRILNIIHLFPGNHKILNSRPLTQHGAIVTILCNAPLVEIHQFQWVVRTDVIMGKRLEGHLDLRPVFRGLSVANSDLAHLGRLG